MNNADMPAMPIQFEYQESENTTQVELWRGLTKREHFAAMAMQGMLANDLHCQYEDEKVARCAVSVADALLLELDKGGES